MHRLTATDYIRPVITQLLHPVPQKRADFVKLVVSTSTETNFEKF